MNIKELPNVVSQRLRSQYTDEALRRLYTLYECLDEFFVEGVDAGVMPALASVYRLKWCDRFHRK